MIWPYRLFLFFVELLVSLFRPFLNEKLQYFINNNGKIFKNSNSSASPIWIHASSGEIEYAIPVIEELTKLYPHIPLLVTHSSLSSRKSLDQLPVAMTGVIPLDSYFSVAKFLTQINPRAFLISRTELWPELTHQLHQRQIPSYLFSATFAPGSKKLNLFSRLLLSKTLVQLKKIFVVSSQDQENAEKLFSQLQVLPLGDTRYDRVATRLAQPSPLSLPDHKKILVLGSLWEEDEKKFLPILPELKNRGWKIIWTPHEIHPHSIPTLETQFQNLGLKSQLLSQKPKADLWENTDILVVDQMGLLAHLYRMARISFVGGSFRKQVHSVMEPLGAYSPVVVGPFYLNNREAIEFEKLGPVKVAQNSLDLLHQIELLDSTHDQMITLLKAEIFKRRGATSRFIHELQKDGLF